MFAGEPRTIWLFVRLMRDDRTDLSLSAMPFVQSTTRPYALSRTYSNPNLRNASIIRSIHLATSTEWHAASVECE